ncbi:MAG: nicotinate-nicotinamide nucleotide adenylyltransferase [Actinobacteria bacterium]|nr:nicotinate-nicotinamide nucleotide adenylyltransferase [Actinomycetota bacterium]
MIGLLGGAFNPPHDGHLELACRALEEFDLDRLEVLVSGDPAHKDVNCPVDVRVGLAKLAFADLPRTSVQADPYRYTIDRLRAEPPPDDAIFLMGADQYRDFASWKEPDAVLERVQLGVATRAGVEPPQLVPGHECRVRFFDIDSPSIASSDLRARARRGEPLDGLVPAAVAAEIARRRLYGPALH